MRLLIFDMRSKMTYGFVLILILSAAQLYAFPPAAGSDSLKLLIDKTNGIEKIKLLLEIASFERNKDPQAALRYCEQAAGLSGLAGDSLLMATALKSAGICCYFAGDYENAEKFYFSALSIFRNRNDLKGISSCENNLAIIYKDRGDYKRALEYYYRSLRADRDAGDVAGVASSLSNIGEVFHVQGQYARAIYFYTESLRLELETGDDEGAAETCLNLGALMQESGNTVEALAYYFRALKIFLLTGNQYRLAQTYNNIGWLFLSAGRVEEAEKYLEKSMDYHRVISDKQGMAGTLANLSRVYRLQGKTEAAEENLFKAIEIEVALGNKRKVSAMLLDYALDLQKKNETQKALDFLLNSMEMAADIGARPELCDAYRMLAEVYGELGDFVNGYKYSRLYMNLADSLESEQIAMPTAMADSVGRAYDDMLVRNKEAEHEKEQKFNEIRIYMVVFICLSAILTVMTIMFFRQRMVLRRMKNK